MANGDCYAANGREIIGADDSARLVHGLIRVMEIILNFQNSYIMLY